MASSNIQVFHRQQVCLSALVVKTTHQSSLVPRPSLLPRSDGLAREVEFLGFMGGATGTLIKY